MKKKRPPGERAVERRRMTEAEIDDLLTDMRSEPAVSFAPLRATAPLPVPAAPPYRLTGSHKNISLRIAARHPWRWAGLMYDWNWLKRKAVENGLREEDARWLLP